MYNKTTSAHWFYEAFNNSPATESGMLWHGCLFVGIGHFDDSSNTDCLMKNSEHPFLQTILNLTLERCQSSDSWMLVSLLPDLEVSDLEKSQSNQKSNGDNLSLRRLKLYHKCSEFLYSAFKDPDQYYDLWVYGFGWMQVYFQVGMIIGDMEQHNKICGFHGGNDLHRQHMSCDCNVISDDADNPNIKCKRKEVKETCRFIS